MSDNKQLGRSLRPRSATTERKVADTFTASAAPASGTRRVKTSLTLDVELYRRAKIAAIERGMTVSEFVEQGMRTMLDR